MFCKFTSLLWEQGNPASVEYGYISWGIALVGLWESPRNTLSYRDIPGMQLHLAVQ